MVSKRSYVQHLGFSNGQNAENFLMGDIGLNFKNYDRETLSIFLDEYLHAERAYHKEILLFLQKILNDNQNKLIEFEKKLKNSKI